MQIQQLSSLHLKSVCFTRVFRFIHPTRAARRRRQPEPGHCFHGNRIYNWPFRPGAITNPSFKETICSFELFYFFVTLIFCFYIFVFYFHSWHESQFQSLLFSFMGWASLFYGVCLCRCMLSYKKRSPLAANLHFSQFTCNMHRDFERTKSTSKNTHVMLALKMELIFIFVNTWLWCGSSSEEMCTLDVNTRMKGIT